MTHVDDSVDILESDVGKKDKKGAVNVHDVFDSRLLSLENQRDQTGNEL